MELHQDGTLAWLCLTAGPFSSRQVVCHRLEGLIQNYRRVRINFEADLSCIEPLGIV